MHNKDKYFHTKELFKNCNVLNVYKLNILNTSVFMHKIRTGSGPSSFGETFEIPSHPYPTRFSSTSYKKPKIKFRKSRFRISIRGPTIWNDFVANTEKELDSSSLFKSRVKSKLLDFENEMTFF